MGNSASACFERSRVKFSSNVFHRNKEEELVVQDKLELDEELLSAVHKTKLFSFEELLTATDSFSSNNRIGRGGFGNTCKGVLSDGTLIATKVRSGQSSQWGQQFINEVSLLAKLEHENLVKLYGCCIEANLMIIVYEYLENRDLARALFGTRSIDFPWDVRRRICIGVATGLAFLHDAGILHGNIRASNVLLDSEFNPKISDFALARFCPPGMYDTTVPVVGTYRYMAPEYALHGRLSFKADIYSFGILILEIVTRRRNFLKRAWDLHEEGELLELVDKSIVGKFGNREEAYRYLIICLLCTQHDPDLRPDMSTIIEMLTGKINVIGENLSRPDLLLQYGSSGDDEGELLKSDFSYLPESLVLDEISGPLQKHKQDGSRSFMYSKEGKRTYQVSSASGFTVFTYKKMKKITKRFKQRICSGHHRIYFGFISNILRARHEPLQVAVKIYDGDGDYQDEDSWLAQVSLFKDLSHPNLVQLIGHCYEAKHRILVYEYLDNGSLADHLFSTDQAPLSWDVRMKIAIDAARGLAYLHENGRPIIHRNIKPSKILIDTVSELAAPVFYAFIQSTSIS